MATPSESRDKFDMHQSLETWDNFLRLAKWIVVLTALLLVWMAIFLTGNPAPGTH